MIAKQTASGQKLMKITPWPFYAPSMPCCKGASA